MVSRPGCALNKIPVISIVDDNEPFRRATAGLIRSLGYVAAIFDSAEEFLRSGRLDETACLISDVQMPGMSWIDLQTHLAAQGRRLPIIFVTAYPERFLTGERPEPAFLIAKPFQPATVSAVISQALFFERKARPRDHRAA